MLHREIFGLHSYTLYKVYEDNLLQNVEDSRQGADIGTTFTGYPTYADGVLLVSSGVSDMQGMLNINHSYSEEWRYSIHPTKSEVFSCTGQDLTRADQGSVKDLCQYQLAMGSIKEAIRQL